MKGPDEPISTGPRSWRGLVQGGEIREHPALLVLFAFALATPLALWTEGPTWARSLAWCGAIAGALLLLRLVLVGFTGYERIVGLRIIRRTAHEAGVVRSPPKGRMWLAFFTATGVLGIAILVTLNHSVGRDDAQLLALLKPVRVGLVFYVAIASFLGLLILIGQRYSVFGTTSIIGIVLGVAALLVVQSVATGFQHEFERRVLGVYAHINVTRAFGISEYRRFEAWLRTLDGVDGASPFVYYAMALAPQGSDQADGPVREATDTLSSLPRSSPASIPAKHFLRVAQRRSGGVDVKLASVLVKGIEPTTADQVIDLVAHLERGSGRPIPLSDLRSSYELMPVPDRPQADLPPVIAETEDPRGPDWYGGAISDWNTREHADDPFRIGPGRERDEVWEDPPEDLDAVVAAEAVDRATLPTMFIGVGLARELELAEGDVVRLVDPGATFDHTEAPKFVHYLIAGVFQAGFQEYDSRLVYIDIKELQRFKYRGKDIVSGVDLRLEDQELAPKIGAMIRQQLNPDPARGEYSILEWQKLNENLFSSIRTQKNIITIILSLVIFVASFNVLSALWTMVVRRTPEVAIIMSMGATGPQVARIFQVTGMTIGLAGSLAGVAFGLIMCWLVELYGYTLDPEVYFIEELPVEISVVQIAWILALGLGFCFIATIPPSLRAARLRPVEGLRYE